MKTSLYHVQLNASDSGKSLPFYKKLFQYFEYEIIDESLEHLGVSNGTTDFWIMTTESKNKINTFHRKNTGINHLAFRVTGKDQVDKFCEEFLTSENIPTLYNSPKYFSEYAPDYYAAYFEDPDRVKLEVMSVL